MPWRGPSEPGEYPTLGWTVGAWIEEFCVIPDGDRKGRPFLLTDDQWNHLLRFFRLVLRARPDTFSDAFVYNGTELVRPQKSGKDPYLAAIVCAQAAGPVLFDGWDAAGEPVGRPWSAPLIQCAATAEDQTANTFRPIVANFTIGPLANLPGLDAGKTQINLPGGGLIEPVTASARARLGAPIIFAALTETHLMRASDGGLAMARVLKRNVAGMDGRWMGVTNAWDPSEGSVAQLDYEARQPHVLIDYRPPRGHVDLRDDKALRREVIYVYGDSCRERGGWISSARIITDIRDPTTGEANARRFFLNELVAGQSDLVDPVRWDAHGQPGMTLSAGEPIALGFDGAQTVDATALIADRMSDGRLFTLRIWERPADAGPDWRVPGLEVDQLVRDTFAAYPVSRMYADPWRWESYLDRWEAEWPDQVVRFFTNRETRIDPAIGRFQTAAAAGELTHDGDPLLARHVKNTVVVNATRRKPRPGENDRNPYYRQLAKKDGGKRIDGSVAAVLANLARADAIADGWAPTPPTASFAYVIGGKPR